ncbi:MAG: hypothetical protein A2Z34_01030 [Planctomycetes bacterium RBG_16_59_8]|nr:MAG: hypothetical protein A2Z34_01030 [Planctomycetes bacterium RBG_16_59_8]
MSKTSQQVTAAVRGTLGQLSSIIQSTTSFAKIQLKDNTIKPSIILVSGGGAKLEGLPHYLSTSLNTPVEPLNPFSRIETTGVPSQFIGKIVELPTDMAAAVGLAQLASARSGRRVVSFLSEGIKKRRHFFQRTIFLYAAASILLATLVFLTISSGGAAAAARQRYENLQNSTTDTLRMIDAFQTTSVRQKELDRVLRELRGQTALSPAILDAVAKLGKILPERAWISGVRVSPENANEGASSATKTSSVDLIGNIEAGLKNRLQQLETQLTDPSRGIAATVTDMKSPDDRKGWITFTMTLTVNAQ